MAKVNNLKRIVVEDFSKEDQDLVQKIAFSYNPLMEQLTSAFNKGIDFENLSQQFSIIRVRVDGSGNPVIPLEMKYELKTKLRGIQVISAQNLTDNAFPTGQPFISYSLSGTIITVNNVTGLPSNKDFSLSVILYG